MIRAAVLWLACAASAHAQSPFLRSADTRTSPPGAVMGQRRSWGAQLSVGGNANRGNIDADFLSSSFSLFTRRSPSTLTLTGGMLYNRFGATRIFNQANVTARWDRDLGPRWRMFAFNTNAFNEFLRLNHRLTSGAGPWLDLAWGTSKHGLSLAVTHEHERFKGGRIERAGRLSLRSLSEIPLAGGAVISADFFYVPRLGAIGDYRLYGEIAARAAVWRDAIGLKASWIGERDSRPQPGVKADDSLWLTALTFNFGA